MQSFFLFIYEIIFGGLGIGGAFESAFGTGLWAWWDVYRFASFFVSAFSFVVTVVCIHKLYQFRQEERAGYNQAIEVIAETEKAEENQDWVRIKNMLNSSNVSDWKVAVLEADKMLDHLISTLGYQGEDLGSKLMKIERADFRTLEEAWQAHKFRNRIAHTPKLDLDRNPFEEAINNFEKVFREFDYI